jgi:ferredoxin
MKKSLFLFLLSVVALVIIVSCSDDVNKMLLSDSQTRIEYSNCTGCYECITEFSCPENAIIKDPATNELTVYIDAEKCVNCLKCINVFSCPDNAITSSPDLEGPGEIDNFEAVSDSAGILDITFTAPGDDGESGLVYRYELQLMNAEENPVSFDFQFPLLLKEAGVTENWQIRDLPPDEEIFVQLQAFDEAGLTSAPVSRNVLIAAEYVDVFPPAQITDLAAESQEEHILLTWSATGDDAMEGSSYGYQIRYAESEITDDVWESAVIIEQDIIPAAPGTLENLSVNEVPWQVDYYFAIKAYDSEGNYSTASNNVEARIVGDIIAPTGITDLTISDVTPQSILLGWSAVGDDGLEGSASAYVIKVSEFEITDENWESIPQYEQTLVPLPSGDLESLNVSGLEPLTTYYLAVKAVDDADNLSELSNIVNDTTIDVPDTIPPAAVSDLSAEADYTEITLTWTSTGDDGYEGSAYQYIIKMSEEIITDNNWDESVILENSPNPLPSGTEQHYTVTGLQPDTDYYFALKVMDAEENISDISNVTQSALLNDTTAPSEVVDLSATGNDTSVTLTWTAPGDDGDDGTVAYYEIKIHTEEINDANWNDATALADLPTPQVAGSNETFVIEELAYYTNYYFALKAFDEVDNGSGLSNVAYILLEEDTTAPASISDLEVHTGNAYSPSTIRIEWTASGDDGMNGTASYCEVRISNTHINDSNWDSSELAVIVTDPGSAGSSETLDVTGLEQGEVVYFALKVFDDSGNSSAVSNSVWGKIVYTIYTGPCNGCGHCINACPEDAITDHGSWASIDYDACDGCGTCVNYCPRNAISRYVINSW